MIIQLMGQLSTFLRVLRIAQHINIRFPYFPKSFSVVSAIKLLYRAIQANFMTSIWQDV